MSDWFLMCTDENGLETWYLKTEGKTGYAFSRAEVREPGEVEAEPKVDE